MQPVVTALRNTYGQDALIELVCLKRSLPAAKLIAGLNAVHHVERSTSEVLDVLKVRAFDFLLDMHCSVRSRSLSRGLGIMTLSVNKKNWHRWLLTRGWRNDPVMPFVDRCLNVIKPFGINSPDTSAYGMHAWGPLSIPSVPSLPSTYMVLGIGSSQSGKHLSQGIIDEIVQAATLLGCTVVLVGGKTEEERATNIMDQYPQILSQVGIWSLGQTSAAIAHAQAVVTGDTVTMHLSSALGVPTATIWGCTRPSLGLAAWRSNPKSIDILPTRDAQSRPCSKHGASCRFTRSKNPFHPQRCSQQVDAKKASQWLVEILNGEKVNQKAP